MSYNFEDLKEIVVRLRGRDGCPWDRVQTHESLRNCMIEEAYETVEAINEKDEENLCEELGDVLFQVLLHSEIAKEQGEFTLEDVINGIAEKMVRRHPHVFGKNGTEDVNGSYLKWEEIKRLEKKERYGNENEKAPLTFVPKAFPALVRGQKVIKKAEEVYGYQAGLEELCNEIQGNLNELKKLSVNGEKERAEENIGNILLQTTQIARFFKGNAENSLTNAIEKFINRFERNKQKNN